MGGITLHRVDKIGDQVVAPLELNVNLGPGFFGPIATADQAVEGNDTGQ